MNALLAITISLISSLSFAMDQDTLEKLLKQDRENWATHAKDNREILEKLLQQEKESREQFATDNKETLERLLQQDTVRWKAHANDIDLKLSHQRYRNIQAERENINLKEAAKKTRDQENAAIHHKLATERNKADAQFRDQLKRKRFEEEQAQQKQHDQERLGREAKAHKERLDNEVEAEKAKARAKAEMEKELRDDEFKRWQDPKQRKAQKEKQEDAARLERENNRDKINAWAQAIFDFTNDKKRMANVGKFVAGTTVATAAGVLFFRHALPIVRKMVEDHLFTPVLIEESSYTRFGWFSKRRKKFQSLKHLYFAPDLQSRVHEIYDTLLNTKKNNGYYLNYLFYGLPGTGKTATARALAYQSGMDFAFMTGGSVLDLLRTGKAIKRLKEVFDWAKSSKKGLLLFIDECDAFLCNPNGDLSEEMNSTLKAFLNYTGSESTNLCLILSTNHPNKLSKAILSRIGYRQQIQFNVPDKRARRKMVSYFANKYVLSNNRIDCLSFDKPLMDYIAHKTEGFVGRDISYLLLGIEKAALAQKTPMITKQLIKTIVQEAVDAYNASQEFTSYA